ncbi:hypothetical protein H8356DRAFT_1419566 [Neocallimastix lanati (nom. inval.)]|nr:hypothetical protein H8356DRAFT_1419566 [Neocallimastix sp. JGI-2020a]
MVILTKFADGNVYCPNFRFPQDYVNVMIVITLPNNPCLMTLLKYCSMLFLGMLLQFLTSFYRKANITKSIETHTSSFGKCINHWDDIVELNEVILEEEFLSKNIYNPSNIIINNYTQQKLKS